MSHKTSTKLPPHNKSAIEVPTQHSTMSQRQQNFLLTHSSLPTDPHPFFSRRHRNFQAVASLLVLLAVAFYHEGGQDNNVSLRQQPSVKDGAIYATNLASRKKQITSTNNGTKLPFNKKTDDETHPWSWIGLLDQLSNQDPSFITSTLKQYAMNKTTYSTHSLFLQGCKSNQLPDKRCGFLGGPESKFSDMAPHVMKVLRALGMNPSSKVLEVGVGLGRNAQSLIHYLEKDKYLGIEPNGDMLAVGVAHLIGNEVLEEKRPMFSTNSEFDFGVFFPNDTTTTKHGESQQELLDVVTSRSVWSHTSKIQNELYLASFAKYSKPSAFLATSVIKITEDCSKDYNGTEWVGKSHDANNEGIVIHCMPWIREVCAKYGLVVKSLEEEVPELMRGVGLERWNDLGQPWIVVRHASSSLNGQ